MKRSFRPLLLPLVLAAGVLLLLLLNRPHDATVAPTPDHTAGPVLSPPEAPAEIPAAADPEPAATPGVPEPGVAGIPSAKSDAAQQRERLLAWTQRWRAASEPDRPALLAEGRELGAARGAAMLDLIRQHPDAALEHALTWAQWAALPAEIQAMVEQPFSVTGDYGVRSDCRPMAERRQQPWHLNWLTAGEASWKIYPTSAWATVTSKDALPVQGIRIGDEAVLRHGAMQVLGAEDAAAVAAIFPVRERDAGGSVTALIGGTLSHFSTVGDADEIASGLATALTMNGPHTVSAGLAVAYSSSSGAGGSIVGGASAASLAWSATPKRVLAMRLDFSDLTGAPLTQAELQNRLQTASNLLSDMSYGKTSFSSTSVTPTVLRLSQPSTSYSSGSLAAEAKSLAAAAGFPTANYDIFIYSLKATASISGAFANLGSGDQWDTGAQGASTFVHETGHNLGLGHANFWVGQLTGGDWMERTGFTSPWGYAQNDEYGDSFDIMAVDFRQAPGSDTVMPNGHFAMDGKVCLGWITPSQVTDATTSGTYRVLRFDNRNTTGGPLALSFRTSDNKRVWVGLRRNFPNNPLLSTGAYVVWAHNPNQHEQIDCTPLSRIDFIPSNGYDVADLDREDSALPTGASWTTPDGTVKLTNLGVGGTTPNEYIDLHLEFTAAVPAAQFFTTQAASVPGLTGSYYNSSLRGVTQQDWTATQTLAGSRVDNPPDFTGPSFGSRAAVGITGGTDGDWENFSVQWDGYVKLNRPSRLATRSDDGSRLWVDIDGNGTFTNTTERFNNGWGTGQGPTVGEYTPILAAGVYKIRAQYEEGNGGNTFRIVVDDQADGNFDLYQAQTTTDYGLTARFVNSSLRAVSAQTDWNGSQTISGTRADPIPVYWDNGMGTRSTVGITGGNDGDWQNFSVQYDGWLKVTRTTRFLSYGADGTRFWIDMDNNASYGSAAPEFTAGNWGSNGVQRFGPFSAWVPPGLYRVRVQHEQDTDGGNRWALMGQNDLSLNGGQGINMAGAGHVTAPGGGTISGNFTVEAWVRPTDPTRELNIVCTRNDFGFDMKVMSGNRIHGDIGTGSAWLNTAADASYAYRVGEWYHVAYCVGAGGYDIYVNGWKAGSGTYSGTPLLCDGTHPFRIGSYNGTLENFAGDIDEVRIWTEKRTGEQIAANFRRTVRGDTPNLASCWRFDETAGTTVADATGQRPGSYVGTVTKAALATPVANLTTLYVSSTADSGPGSLHDTVAFANTLPGPVTINVTANGTIRRAPSPETVFDVSNNITINGPGSNALTLSAVASNGNVKGLVFVTNTGSLTLRGVALADAILSGIGDGSGGGSAVWNTGGSVLLEDCVVRNCVSGNDLGGACFNSGTFTARRTTFWQNRCDGVVGTSKGSGSSGGGGGGGAGMGGAVFSDAGTLTLEDCSFVENRASGGAGGTGGQNNSADPTGGDGGSPTGGAGATAQGAAGGAGGYGGGGGGGGRWISAAQPGNGGAGGYGAGGGGGGARVTGGNGGTGGAGNLGGNGGGGASSYAGGGGGGAGLGGAVYVRSGTARIVNCAFRDNVAKGGQGGAGGLGSGNGANGKGLGGAVYRDPAAKVQIVRPSFLRNSADDGTGDGNDPITASCLTAGFNFEFAPATGFGDATGNTILNRFGTPAIDLGSDGSSLALHCNGTNQYARLTSAAFPGDSLTALGLKGSFTAMARAKATVLSGDRMIFGSTAPGSPGALHFGFRNGKPFMGFHSNDLLGNATVPLNQSVHVAFVYDAQAGQRSIYLDGRLDSTEMGISNTLVSSDVLIGSTAFAGSFFGGDLDEVLIFSTPLNATQIAGMAAAPRLQAAPFPFTLVPSPALPIPDPGGSAWSSVHARLTGYPLDSIAKADYLMALTAPGLQQTSVANMLFAGFTDPGGPTPAVTRRFATWYPFALSGPGDDDNFAVSARMKLHITTENDYTFGFSGDDGIRLRIRGAAFTGSTRLNTGNTANPAHAGDTLVFPNATAEAITLGVTHLVPGDYEVEFLWFEAGGGAWAEVYAAEGVKTALDSSFRALTPAQFDATAGPAIETSWDATGLHGFFVEKPGWIFESSTTLSSWSPATVTPSSAGVSTFGSNLQRQFFRFRKP